MTRFRIVVADPPWSYRQDWGNGAVCHHYPTLTTEALMALPVGELALADSALFLWVTNPNLDVGLDVLRAWGFTFATVGFVWEKTNRDGSPYMGLGYYTRSATEQVLIGVKGKMSIYRQRKDVRQLVRAPRLLHSEKPEEVQDRIERLFPGPYLELFARRVRPGWTCIGDAVDGLDIADSLARLLALPALEPTEGVA